MNNRANLQHKFLSARVAALEEKVALLEKLRCDCPPVETEREAAQRYIDKIDRICLSSRTTMTWNQYRFLSDARNWALRYGYLSLKQRAVVDRIIGELS